jgi:hypothetical protein
VTIMAYSAPPCVSITKKLITKILRGSCLPREKLV